MSENILKYLKRKSYSDATLEHVRSVFNKLDLPLPKSNEFFKTDDLGALVLLSRFGCVLRFTTCSYPSLTHTNILQPLTSFPDKIMRAELFPGLATPFTSRDYSVWFKIYEKMEGELEKDGIQVNDINGNNGGKLPSPYQNRYVFIDPGALKQLTGASRDVYRQLPLDSKDPQEILFGHLKASFENALANDNSQAISMAWQECIQMKDKGILVSNWDDVDYSGTKKAGSLYNSRLQTMRLS